MTLVMFCMTLVNYIALFSTVSLQMASVMLDIAPTSPKGHGRGLMMRQGPEKEGVSYSSTVSIQKEKVIADAHIQIGGLLLELAMTESGKMTEQITSQSPERLDCRQLATLRANFEDAFFYLVLANCNADR